MKILRCSVLTLSLLAAPMAGSASAVTVEDLLNLQANGLGDDVLVALIATDGSSFNLSAADVLALHRRGLSERVILAMVASGQRRAPRPATEPSEGSQTPAPAPTVVNVHQTVTQLVETPVPVIIPFPIAVPVIAAPPRPQPAPTYWGFGGRLRADAWGQPEKSEKSDKPAEPAPVRRR